MITACWPVVSFTKSPSIHGCSSRYILTYRPSFGKRSLRYQQETRQPPSNLGCSSSCISSYHWQMIIKTPERDLTIAVNTWLLIELYRKVSSDASPANDHRDTRETSYKNSFLHIIQKIVPIQGRQVLTPSVEHNRFAGA